MSVVHALRWIVVKRTSRRGWPEQREIVGDLRRRPTPAERLLWERLRNRQLDGFKFRRQHPIGRFVVDFYCVEAGLALEVDGLIHDRQRDADNLRDRHLRDEGVNVLRVKNDDVMNNLSAVLDRIAESLRQCRT
jgi:very-short-patch-repair endonuclease